ncbi:MAG TPA: Xaa-Pro peptidase family protein [Acidimicrobiia bacterium]|nr:Xaa-Pro peptidase family protein [Acidimicrobiia bacterium]
MNTAHPRESARKRLGDLAAESDVDAVVLSSYQAVSYFGRTQIMTQVSIPDRLAYLLVSSDGSASLVLCSLETRLVRGQTDLSEIVEYTEFVDNPAAVLANLLRERDLDGGRLGIEARRLSLTDAEFLRSELPSLELVALDEEIERSQSVKERHEIDSLGYAAQSTRASILEGAEAATIGTTERELCAQIMSRVMERGGIPTFVVFGSGPRSLETHSEPIDKKLTEGEIWRIDAGARFDGVFNSDLARTGVVGPPQSRQTEVLQALRATQTAGFNVVEPGRPASEVFRAVEAEFDSQGLPFFMPHVGHGLGIGLHEAPMLQPANDTPLQAGMVLCIEPMVQLPDENECYHVEDLVEVTEDGFRKLSEPQDELIQIG